VETKTCVKGTVARDYWPSFFFFMKDPIWISDSYPKFGVLLFETKIESLLEYDSGVHMGLIHGRNRDRKYRATVPLKSSQ
jgi:hypothetical protein